VTKMSDYDQERWVDLYRAVMMEFEHSLMAGRLADARAEIVKRLEKVQEMPALHRAERHAIEDAVTGLRIVEEEDARHSSEQQRKVAQDDGTAGISQTDGG
jgi:hypothetical protein